MIFITVGHAPYPFNRMRDRIETFMKASSTPWMLIQCGVTPWTHGTLTFSRESQLTSIQEAECVITHCGAGTILDCWQAGHKPIVLPRRALYGEHVNDHQQDLYEALLARRMIFSLPDDHEELQEVIAKASRGRPWGIHMSQNVNLVRAMLEEILA